MSLSVTTGECADLLQEGHLPPRGGKGTVLPYLLTFQKKLGIKDFCDIFLFLKPWRGQTLFILWMVSLKSLNEHIFKTSSV